MLRQMAGSPRPCGGQMAAPGPDLTPAPVHGWNSRHSTFLPTPTSPEGSFMGLAWARSDMQRG